MTNQLIIEGDLEATAQLEQQIRDELAALEIDDMVTVDAQITPVEVAPGEMGFGEEIRLIMIGVSKLLSAVPDATVKVAEGIKGRLSQGSARVEISPDQNIRIVVRGKDQSNIPEIAREVARVLRAQQSKPKPDTASGD
jgi:hypothetical protein